MGGVSQEAGGGTGQEFGNVFKMNQKIKLVLLNSDMSFQFDFLI